MKQIKEQKQVQPTSKKTEKSLSYMVEVRDKGGRVLQRISAPSRSYVEQWNQMMNIRADGESRNVTDSAGTTRLCSATISNFQCNAPIASLTLGIRVGKGTTAVAIDDCALEIPLGEGTGLNEFNHQAQTFTEPSVAGSTCSFTIKRIMVNRSGATITGIREIGNTSSFPPVPLLLFRDVLPSAVYVPHGGSITVTYTIKVTV